MKNTMGLLIKYLRTGRVFLPQDLIDFINDLKQILLLNRLFSNTVTPHQIEYPFSHERKIDIEDSQGPVKIENDRLDGGQYRHRIKNNCPYLYQDRRGKLVQFLFLSLFSTLNTLKKTYLQTTIIKFS